MKKRRLFTPGPTPLVPAARQAMAAPLLHHRTEEFTRQLGRLSAQLQEIFETSSPVLVLTSSGTGAMEATLTGLAAPEGRALAVVAGKFGERWQEIALRHGVDCAALKLEYGQTAPAGEVAAAVTRHEADLLLLQGCETSTGTRFDLQSIAAAVRAARPSTLIVVDAITAVGSQQLEMDAWDLDAVISGSQKAFSAPPGLAFVALGDRARRAIADGDSGGYYLDLKRELAGQPAGRTAFTPAVTLVAAVEAAAAEILAQGLDSVIEEAARMAAATRAGLTAVGFRLLSESPANAVTAAFPPRNVAADDLRRRLDDELGLKVAGGQGCLKGQIVRIAHLGYFDRLDVLTVLSAVELALASLTGTPATGKSVQAALASLQEAEAVGAGR